MEKSISDSFHRTPACTFKKLEKLFVTSEVEIYKQHSQGNHFSVQNIVLTWHQVSIALA